MGKIKTREKVKNIKLLDKSAVAGQRMKDAFIRSKDRAAELTDDRQATPGEYAGDKVQAAADDMAHDAANVAVSGTKTAARQGKKAFQQHRAKKAAEKLQANAPPQEQLPAPIPQTGAAPEGTRPQPSTGVVRRNQPSPPPTGEARRDQPPQPKTPERLVRAADTPDPVVERGRQFARQQAKKRADTGRTLQNRAAWTDRPAIKTRDALDAPRQAETVTGRAASAASQPVRSVKQTAKSTGRATVKAANGTIKTTRRTVKTARQAPKAAVKTAERTSKTAIKTAQTTAKVSQRAAQATARAAKAAAQTARATSKAAVTTIKTAARASTAAVKAIIAGTKALITAIAAGGWVAVLAVIVICLVGLLAGSCFGIFFSGEDSGTGQTMPTAVREINQDYENRLETIKADHPHDVLEMSGSRALWPEVLAIYAVKTTTDPEHGQEVASMDDKKKALLKELFWAMHGISYRVETRTEGSGEEETTVTYLYITVTHKTADEMTDELRFTSDQRRQLAELLAEENRRLWSAVLYGIGAGDGEIVTVALSQIGNIGGEPYWSWYGFNSRVEWCACFVSWCADQCGYLDAGVIPRFAGCGIGAQWFMDRGLWQDRYYEPRAGDIIFFDWDDEDAGQDGELDHVGIVAKVENGTVHTIEGNSGDSCRERQYSVGYYEIYGYGTPAY